MKKILRVGGRSISGELAPRGPDPLPFRDFFLAQQNFWHAQSGRDVPSKFELKKRLRFPTLSGWPKSGPSKDARLPLIFRRFIFRLHKTPPTAR
jgi:hypothetical protein